MSSKARIERLGFTNFRGACRPVTFDFQPNFDVVLIFGENGTGKSTIADALDFLCNNDFGSLRLRSGTTPRNQIVSSQGNSKDLAVEMVYGGTRWRATLQGGKPVTTPPKPPRAFVLRRADITRIMEATDSERYKSLNEFITVPRIESCETTLRNLCKSLSGEVDQAIQQKATAETTLRHFWSAEGQPGGHHLAWARWAVQQPVAALREQVGREKALLDVLAQAVLAQQTLTQAERHLVQAQSHHLGQLQQLQQASQVQPNAALVATLQAAETYLHGHPETDRCPVCARPEEPALLLMQIETQLLELNQIQTLLRNLEQSAAALQQAEGVRTAAHERWRSVYSDLVSGLQDAPAGFAADVHIATTTDDIGAYETVQQLADEQPLLARRIDNAGRVLAQHSALVASLATIDRLSESMQAKHALNQRVKAMLAVVEEERKQYVENTVNTISGVVSELYSRLHPGESLGAPSFGLKKKTIGSLTLTGDFGGASGVPPAAYYSEAHLDTLGLCVYLALAKQAGNALVVLDDVLMSVDDPHLDRVIDLINDEAHHFGQVIITTHSRAWFDRVRSGQAMRADLIELYGWDYDHGMQHNRAPLAVEELRSAVQAPRLDRQTVAARAGVLLEQLLDELTLRFAARLPRKHAPHYTLGELAGGLDKRLLALLRIEQLDTAGVPGASLALKDLIEVCTQDAWIRNQVGAHFNPNAAGIADSTIRQFGVHVLKLADALLCPRCRQLPRKNKSGSYWECGGGCGKTRLYPLQTP